MELNFNSLILYCCNVRKKDQTKKLKPIKFIHNEPKNSYCEICSSNITRITKQYHTLKIGSSYYYFCNQNCYYKWLSK